MAEETGNAVVQLLQLVHAQMPGAHVVSLALLPKGEVWPNRCSDAITAVNAQLEVRKRLHGLSSTHSNTELPDGPIVREHHSLLVNQLGPCCREHHPPLVPKARAHVEAGGVLLTTELPVLVAFLRAGANPDKPYPLP